MAKLLEKLRRTQNNFARLSDKSEKLGQKVLQRRNSLAEFSKKFQFCSQKNLNKLKKSFVRLTISDYEMQLFPSES